MIWTVCIVGLALSTAASALFSGSETGIYCVNRLRLQLSRQRGSRSARHLHDLLEDEQNALSMTLVGTNLSNYLLRFFSHCCSVGDGPCRKGRSSCTPRWR